MVNQELEYRRFQEYLATKRANLAPSFGATVLASTITLGLTEVPQPNTEYREKAFTSTYSPRLGTIALENQLGPKPAFDLTPQAVAFGHTQDYELAA